MATPYDRLKSLTQRQGLSINELEERVGLGRNTLYSWKTKVPSGTNLMKVADYFHVSTDYLLGRESKADMVHNMTVDEALGTIMSYNGKPVSDHDKRVMKDLLEAYLRSKGE